jgi:hypothetical protein
MNIKIKLKNPMELHAGTPLGLHGDCMYPVHALAYT